MDIIEKIPHKVSEKHVEKKLYWRLRIFKIIAILLMIIAILDITKGKIHILLSALGVSLGILIGMIVGRSINVYWHPKIKKVVYGLDFFGIFIFCIYIFLEIKRDWIFGHWIDGVFLSSFYIVFATGIFFGRFLSIKNKICSILEEKGKL